MEFKKLELKSESNWFKRTFLSKHAIRTYVFTIIGALAGFLLFFYGQWKSMQTIETGDIVKSMLMGALFGIFITNSSCARGRC